MKLRTLSDRIIVKKVNVERKSAGGLFLGNIDSERDFTYGNVVATGPGKQVDGTGMLPMTIKVGDLVLYNDAIAKRIDQAGEEFWVIRESDVYAIDDDQAAVIVPFVSEKMEKVETRKLDRL